MAYGSLLTDVVQSSTAGTPPQFNDGNGTQTGTLCRAWVKFAGATGTVTTSFNVSSVTRNGTGDYTMSFTNALADGNYCMTSAAQSLNNTGNWVLIKYANTPYSPAAGSCRVTCGDQAAAIDPNSVMCAFFR